MTMNSYRARQDGCPAECWRNKSGTITPLTDLSDKELTQRLSWLRSHQHAIRPIVDAELRMKKITAELNRRGVFPSNGWKNRSDARPELASQPMRER
jgi:hypothetical protein